MVTASKDVTAATAPALVASPAGGLTARLAGGLVLWLRGLYTRHELMRLDDRALADIGAARSELGEFAKQSDPWRQLPRASVSILALAAMIDRVDNWRERRRQQAQTYRELMAYSDAELTDLGISRRDIGTIARSDGRAWPA